MPKPEGRRYLAEVLVATTWDCNLACRYCFVRERGLTTTRQRMSPETATRVVDALDEAFDNVEVIGIHLYGGEPLTNLPAMEAMLKRTDRKAAGRFRFAITTNGMAASAAAFELLEAGRFQVILSIDGPPEIHDECRRTVGGEPTHDAVMRFLRELRSRTHCWVRGSAVVRSGWSLAQASAFLRSLPVDAIKAQAVRVPPGTPYALSDAEKRAYLDDLGKIGEQVIEDLEEGRSPRDDRYSARVLQLLTGGTRESFCGAGDWTYGITPEGSVLPCVLMNAVTERLGNLAGHPRTWREAGRHWRAAQKRRARCRQCSALALCGGGCPAMLPVCGEDECEIIRTNCEVARGIYEHFRFSPLKLLALADKP